MVSVVVAKPNGRIVGLVFCVENIDGRRAIFWTEYFYRAIEKFADGLNLRVVTMNSILSFTENVLLKWLTGYKLRKVFFVSVLCFVAEKSA